MDAAARINQLVETLRLHGRVDVATAAAEFGTAEMTVRRDLDVLVERGVARRVRGGAVNLMMRGEELPFAMRELDALDTKKRIASDVAGLIADGEAVRGAGEIGGGAGALEAAETLGLGECADFIQDGQGGQLAIDEGERAGDREAACGVSGG